MRASRYVLLISPHSDDEVLGAGGTLMKLREQGAEVLLALVACSDVEQRHIGHVRAQEREQEFLAASEHLATLPPLVFWHPDGALDLVGQGKMVKQLDTLLDDYKPTDLFIPEPSYHQDHRAVNQACIAALRPTGTWRPNRVYEYEVPAMFGRGERDAFIPNVFYDIDVDRKIQVFRECYPSQFTEDERGPLAASGIRKHAAFRGLQAGLESAEAFHLVREVVR